MIAKLNDQTSLNEITLSEKKVSDIPNGDQVIKNQVSMDLSQVKVVKEKKSKVLNALKKKVENTKDVNEMIEVNVNLKYNANISKKDFIQKYGAELRNSSINSNGHGENSFFCKT